MDRNNPYEAAFEGYLKTQGLCYVGVDEGRRAMLGEMPVKNLDFIVLGACGSRLLIDVKGRQFPGGTSEKPRYGWENWATHDDVAGLRSWLDVFGPGYTALFLFIYKIGPTVEIPADSTTCGPSASNNTWGGRSRSTIRHPYEVAKPKWAPSIFDKHYRELARPFRYFTHDLLPQPSQGDRHAEEGTRDLSESLDSALASLAPPRGTVGVERP